MKISVKIFRKLLDNRICVMIRQAGPDAEPSEYEVVFSWVMRADAGEMARDV